MLINIHTTIRNIRYIALNIIIIVLSLQPKIKATRKNPAPYNYKPLASQDEALL
jgi:hypothetical protein